MKILLSGAALAAIAVTLAPTGAQAAEPAPTPPPMVTVGSVDVETYDEAGNLISTNHYGPETEGEVIETDPIPIDPKLPPPVYADGSGGTSSASGCRKVTVHNERETLLGTTAFKFHTWTRWCWNRADQRVTGTPTTGWSISDVGSFEEWQGVINKTLYFYDYGANNGYPRSAYYHQRTGHFKNCVPQAGCIKNTYPKNTLRSYYNGKWSWTTSD